MGLSLQSGSLDIATLRQQYQIGMLCLTELIESVYERIVRYAFPHIHALVAPGGKLRGLPRVAGSAA